MYEEINTYRHTLYIGKPFSNMKIIMFFSYGWLFWLLQIQSYTKTHVHSEYT